jgi:hypothetical protein
MKDKAIEEHDLPQCIICDLDGTIALLKDRDPHNASTSEEDELDEVVSDVVRRYAVDHDIIIVSGRNARWQAETERWLKKHDIPYTHLYMRPDGDFRRDVIFKKEIYERYIRGKWWVRFVLEDRDRVVAMWRQEGLRCFQVAEAAF